MKRPFSMCKGGPWIVLFLAMMGAPCRAHGAINLFGDNALRVHLLLNHLPIFGTILSVFALVLAFFWKSDAARRIALVLLLVSTASAYLVFQAGEGAYEEGRKIADDPGWNWIDVHMSRGEKGIYVFYSAALVTALALFAEVRKLRWAIPLTIAAGILGTAAFGASVWIADAGGKIRHSELRADPLEKDSHEKDSHENIGPSRNP